MGSSYYITYGGNRLTFPGATGSVAWEYVPPSGYHETLLWSGTIMASGSVANLSQHPSAFDYIRVQPGGGNQGNNSLLYMPVNVKWKDLSGTNNLWIHNPFFGSTATSGVANGWWFGMQITGCSSTSWSVNFGYGVRWARPSASSIRYDFTQVREIWGITYG